jgi:two-component sensor histidine kinase
MTPLSEKPETRSAPEHEQSPLLDELNHRVKNMLATIQSIAIQTLKGTDSPARDAFLSRLFAITGQYDLLIGDNWKGASLEGVIRLALRPYRRDDQARFVVSGPPLYLTPKRALALGMAFHELAINAAAYGALSDPGGQVQVHWTVEDGVMHLTWTETGGPAIAPPTRKGFGLRLIGQGLPHEISGIVRLNWPPEGLVCSWDMPLD